MMFTLTIFTKSKRIEVKGPSFKASHKLTGFSGIALALNDIYKSYGVDTAGTGEAARLLFGDNPTQCSMHGFSFTKIKNGYLIRKQ